MNYVIIRSKNDYSPIDTKPIIAFECSYGLENDNGSNGFSVKIAESEGLVELGSFVQFGANNDKQLSYQFYRKAKTDWCGKILNRDIDKTTGIVTYTGVSLIGAINNLVPVRDTEKITVYNIRSVSNGNVYSSLAAVPDNIITTGFGAIKSRFPSMAFTSVHSRLNELLNLAHYPIQIHRDKDTTFGDNSRPTNFDSSRENWDTRLSPYINYMFGVDDRTLNTFRWRYCTDGSVYTYEETIPSGVSINFEVTGYTAEIELNHYSGVMDSIGDALIVDSELRITSAGNLPEILVSCRHPLTTDYIYIHDKLGMKIFSAMPYTATAKGVEEGGPSYFDTALYRLLNNSGTTSSWDMDYGYYDLAYGQWLACGNDEALEITGAHQLAYGGNLHMLKDESFDYQKLWEQGKEDIEKLSHEITVDGTDDPDYVLQHEYIFLFPQQFPEKLLSDSSPAGAHAMKMILKNKKVVADAYTHKVVYSFYPELSYERGQ